MGVAAVWHWLAGRGTLAAGVLVVAGCMLLFAALFAAKRDHEALDYAGWFLVPEWKFFERLPGWAATAVVAMAALMLAMMTAAIAAALLT